MSGHRRWSGIALAASFVLTSLGLAAVAPAAQAATVTTAQIDCDASAANVSLGSTLTTSDDLVVSYVRCNGWTLSWANPPFSAAGTMSENSANAQTHTIPVRTSSSVSDGAALFTWTKSGSPTITVYQGTSSSTWTAKTPPNGSIGTPYSNYQFVGPGPSGDYTVTSGSEPAGLTLSTTGLLTGTPTRIGTFTFTVSRAGQSETSGSVSVTISGPVVDKVTICHRTRATTNPYVLITVSVNSVIGSGGGNGHSDHNTTRTNTTNPTTNGISPGSGPFDIGFTYPANRKWWGDIIPPFTYATGTYAGLNWDPLWNSPDPTSGTASWLEASEFAAAITGSSSTAFPSLSNRLIYREAVNECIDLGAGTPGTQSAKSADVDTPDKYFTVAINNGEDSDSVREDLVEQEAIDGSGSSPRTIPAVASLESTYSSSPSAKVTTDAASNLTETTAKLNGTLKSGTTWTSWKYQWATTRSGVQDGTGSSYTYNPSTDPAITSGAFTPERIVTGLTCNTTYYFRVVGTSSSGDSFGLVRSFTTVSCTNNGGGGNNNGGGGNNNGGGNGNSGNGGSGGSTNATPTTNTTPAPNRNLGNGRPTRVTLPPVATPNTPGTSTPGRPGNNGTTGTNNGNGTTGTTGGTNNTGSQTPATSTTPERSGPQTVNPVASVPAPPGDAWVPEEVRLEDPRTGEPTPRVVDNQGTWVVNPRSGTVSFTPAPNFVGTAVLNVKLTARSGLIQIQPIRIRVGAASRILVIKGGVPSDILGGILRWQ